jgi:hypothetical protein
MSFTLIDDGTLDTVIRCDKCGEEMRFNCLVFLSNLRLIAWAVSEAEENHECAVNRAKDK